MSSPPKRRLDSDEPPSLERSLLAAGASVSLDPDRRARLWQSISAQLPPGDGSQHGDPASGSREPPVGPVDPVGQASGPISPGDAPTAGPIRPADAPTEPTSPSGGPPGPSSPAGAPPPGPSPAGIPSGASPLPPAPSGLPGSSSGLLSTVGAKGAAWGAVLGLTVLAGYWVADPIGFSPRPATAPLVEASARPEPRASASAPVAVVPAVRGEAPVTAASASPSGASATGGRRATGGASEEPAPRPTSDVAAPAEAAGGRASGSASAAPGASGVAAAPALTPAEEAAVERANRLREEAELTRQARSALRAGSPGEALRKLAEAQARFGGGGLSQEREALTIEALADAGQRDQARTRAEAFLRAYPTSPHAADLRRFAP